MGYFIEQLNWVEVDSCIKKDWTAVLPVAASSKEHGKHLPMNTDLIQVQWLLNQLIEELDVLVWPVVGYGYYPAFVNYSGSVSLQQATFENLIQDVVDNMFKHGVSEITILNAGISTIKPLRHLSQSENNLGKLYLCNIYQGEQFVTTEQKISKQANGGHADEIETSIMLAIAPESVDMSKARRADEDYYEKGELQHEYPLQKNYSANGVMGDPSIATIEKGQQLISSMHDDVRSFLMQIVKGV